MLLFKNNLICKLKENRIIDTFKINFMLSAYYCTLMPLLNSQYCL